MSPILVTGGIPGSGVVTLDGPAGPGGISVKLSCSSKSASIPASVTVPNGKISATFKIGTMAVTANANATITATLNGTSVQATLAILAPAVGSITVQPSTVVGPTTVSCNINLVSQAGPGGVLVHLSSNNPAASVAPTLKFELGQESLNIDVQVLQVKGQTVATVTASVGNSSVQTTITINPIALSYLTVSPAKVVGGIAVGGTVALTVNAQANIVVKLKGNSTSVTMQPSVTIPPGGNSFTFIVKTKPVEIPTTITLDATWNDQSVATTLELEPPSPSAIGVSPSTLFGGATATGVIELNGSAPPGGLKVKLTSTSNSVIVPDSVTVPAGDEGKEYTIKTAPVATQTAVTITASSAGTAVSAQIVIEPPSLSSLSVEPTSLTGGKTAVGTVRLSSEAPPGGIVVSLASSTPSATTPVSVTVPAGKSTATFSIKTSPVRTKTEATISISLGGFAKTATLTLN